MRIFENTNYNFIRWRWHALALSLIVIGAGVVTIISRGGLPLGVDFTGGTVVILEFTTPVQADQIRQALGPLGADAVVQHTGPADQNAFMIRLPLGPGGESADLGATTSRVEQAMTAAGLGYKTPPLGRDVVGPVVGGDLKHKATLATVFALAGILVYLGFRFRFSFAAGAIAATLHDIAVTLVMLTWFHYDISLNVIAAILTIAGYSVNDTIVIFDRVRENQRNNRRESLTSVVNTSVNQTLGRTIITAGTTFLAVLALFLFGGEVLEGFAFTMLVGIITGTYSTVFIASAIAIVLSPKPSAAGQTARVAEVGRKAKARG
jgi:preprotein translocase subunit SecF